VLCDNNGTAAELLRDAVRNCVIEWLGGPDGVLVVDHTYIMKRESWAVGVECQDSVTTDYDYNYYQDGVFLAYVNGPGQAALIDRHLYLSRDWVENKRGLIPHEVTFACESQIAGQSILAALDAGVPCSWVLARAAYGLDVELRGQLEERKKPYVLAFRRTELPVEIDWLDDVDEWVAVSEEEDWAKIAILTGVKGEVPGFEHWFLIWRNRAAPDQRAYYIAFAHEGTALADLVGVVWSGSAIKDCFQSVNDYIPLDRGDSVSWDAWHWHVGLCLAASCVARRTKQGEGFAPAPLRETSTIIVGRDDRGSADAVSAPPDGDGSEADGPVENTMVFDGGSVLEEITRRFGQVSGEVSDGYQRARAYLEILLRDDARETTLMAAEADLERTRMQEMLHDSDWTAAEELLKVVRDYAIEWLGGPDGVLVVDHTLFMKRGPWAVGVQRQHSATTDYDYDYYQDGVFLAYVNGPGQAALIDRHLYLSRDWVENKRGLIPQEVTFARQSQIACQLILAALDARVPCSWVLARAAYGLDDELRGQLEERKKPYVLAFRRTELRDELPGLDPSKWVTLTTSEGSEGEDWARVAISRAEGDVMGFKHWILIRRNCYASDQHTYYIAFAHEGTPLADLAGVVWSGWTSEKCFQSVKNYIPLDQCWAISWDAWHWHVSMCMAAAFVARHTKEGGPSLRGDVKALVEKLRRKKDIQPLEEAEDLRRLTKDFGYTATSLAKMITKSRRYVNDRIALLTLPLPIQKMISDESLPVSHANMLTRAKNPADLAKKVVDDELSFKQTIKLVRESIAKDGETQDDVDLTGNEGAANSFDKTRHLTDKDWNELCRQMPAILRRRGYAKTNRSIVNAIIVHLETGCALRVLSKYLFRNFTFINNSIRRWQIDHPTLWEKLEPFLRLHGYALNWGVRPFPSRERRKKPVRAVAQEASSRQLRS
jgi:SRSO17 transposase